MKKGFMALIIVGTFFLSSAVAQAVVIGFDDITTNGGIAAWNGDRYQAQGVTFSTDGAGGLFAYGGGTYTNTLPNYAYGSSIGSGTAANSKIIATFSSPVNFLSFYLAGSSPLFYLPVLWRLEVSGAVQALSEIVCVGVFLPLESRCESPLQHYWRKPWSI